MIQKTVCKTERKTWTKHKGDKDSGNREGSMAENLKVTK
jgi:hypothetical protein